MKFWPFQRKSKKQKEITDSYTGDISLDKAVEVITSELGVGGYTGSGQVVNEKTAMQFSAVYACVSLLAGTIASLPFEVFKQIAPGETDIDKSNPVYPIINSTPNPVITAYVFWETVCSELFLNGNGYAVISRSQNGAPSAIYWLPQRSVTPFLNPDKTRIWYRVDLGQALNQVFDQDDILHFPCIGWDGLRGMSPIACASESIGLGLAGENFNSKFFTNASAK